MKFEIENLRLGFECRSLVRQRPSTSSNFEFRISNFLRDSAFTLIELLVVIVVIGILLGLLTPALRNTRENAKNKQAATERATLTAAIWAYRHEYGRWPCDATYGTMMYASNNSDVIDYLTKPGSGYNERGVRFMDTGNYIFDRSGNVLNPWKAAYAITIDLNSDTVSVQ